MHEQMMNLTKNLSISYEIALSIGVSLDLQEMLDKVLRTVVRKGDAFRGLAWLREEKGFKCVASAGFSARDCEQAIPEQIKDTFQEVLISGKPLILRDNDISFKYLCVSNCQCEEEILLIPIGNLAIIQISFTYSGAQGLAAILSGIAPKLSTAILSCLNNDALLDMERAERHILEKRYQHIVESLDAGIYISSLEGTFLEANQAFLRMFGFKNIEELQQISWQSLYAKASERDRLILMIMEQGRVKNQEVLLRRKDGEVFWAKLTSALRVINGDNIKVFMGIIEDITERKCVEEQLQYMATHDALTNIPNRYFLEGALKRAVAKAKRGESSALLLIDLDNFKLVNDSLGHAAGDELLISLANILRKNIREVDFLARLGGDEFAVLLEGLTTEEVWSAAERLRRAVDESELYLCIYQRVFNLSISIGIVMIDGALDYPKLLSRADTALYAAKDKGRNRIVLVPPEEDNSIKYSEVSQLISLIKNALRENKFVLYYQPIVNIKDGVITHHEALVRLKGEEDGEIISPMVFIPVAERFGLMSQIDSWVVSASLSELNRYQELNLFINISAVSLSDESLLESIEAEILASGVEPARLGFEVTETAAVKDLMRAERWIRRLKGIGCRFALDDFGTGFSSFSYLRMLPVDFVKIDGSFVRSIDKDPTHQALVQAMNTVAHTLGKKTVAEFVENLAVLQKLHELGIDWGQGYFLGRPSPLPMGISGVAKKS